MFAKIAHTETDKPIGLSEILQIYLYSWRKKSIYLQDMDNASGFTLVKVFKTFFVIKWLIQYIQGAFQVF